MLNVYKVAVAVNSVSQIMWASRHPSRESFTRRCSCYHVFLVLVFGASSDDWYTVDYGTAVAVRTVVLLFFLSYLLLFVCVHCFTLQVLCSYLTSMPEQFIRTQPFHYRFHTNVSDHEESC